MPEPVAAMTVARPPSFTSRTAAATASFWNQCNGNGFTVPDGCAGTGAWARSPAGTVCSAVAVVSTAVLLLRVLRLGRWGGRTYCCYSGTQPRTSR
ncbi:hypothetical protein KCH_77740 [Kitasatospora cheerisanensis KCTC 2395]|uniref:Uncharacterized protein n=1 Tax=Kitasatospora cheerisanensis KCTC 2395 TaxID=1348663 RepID=A0A066YQX1_9ACTN|nr:hypothetical protein KCH_77740 [Kitasatospora cheerisanensis KCTC 2395]